MKDIFNTPQQGKMLDQLAQNMDYNFVWVNGDFSTVHRRSFAEKTNKQHYPALTMQELRNLKISIDDYEIDDITRYGDAPQLADYIIYLLKQ